MAANFLLQRCLNFHFLLFQFVSFYLCLVNATRIFCIGNLASFSDSWHYVCDCCYLPAERGLLKTHNKKRPKEKTKLCAQLTQFVCAVCAESILSNKAAVHTAQAHTHINRENLPYKHKYPCKLKPGSVHNTFTQQSREHTGRHDADSQRSRISLREHQTRLDSTSFQLPLLLLFLCSCLAVPFGQLTMADCSHTFKTSPKLNVR